MSKKDVFLIRENALNILVEAYKKCVVDKQIPDQIRCYNFNNEHFGKCCSEEEFNICKAYLANINAIKFISPGIIAINGKGIDIAEETIKSDKKSVVHDR